MTTKALLVKGYLRDLANSMAVVPVEQVQVTYGFPMGGPDKRWIAVGEITWDGSEWKTNRSRDESFSIKVIFDVQLAGGTAEQVEAYAELMSREFEDRLTSDPSMGGLCITSVYTARTMRSFPSDRTTYECQFETEVRATCRV